MSEKPDPKRTDAEADQRRDAMLLKLLKTPPQQRPRRDRERDHQEGRDDGESPNDHDPH